MRSNFVMLFFDLPSKTALEKKAYRGFVNHLKKNGYRRIQKSIFVKHLRNTGSIRSELLLIHGFAPDGNVAMLPISAKQFASIKYISGERTPIELFTDPVVVA